MRLCSPSKVPDRGDDFAPDVQEAEDKREAENDPTVWNEGRLMTMLGIEPTLFGWNEEKEDWDE